MPGSTARKLEEYALVEPRTISIGSRMAQPYVDEVRRKNDEVWQNRRHWFLGFYFGVGDDRLWVPARLKRMQPHPSKRIINFMHPEGAKALPILMLCYFVAGVTVTMVAAMLMGARW